MIKTYSLPHSLVDGYSFLSFFFVFKLFLSSSFSLCSSEQRIDSDLITQRQLLAWCLKQSFKAQLNLGQKKQDRSVMRTRCSKRSTINT